MATAPCRSRGSRRKPCKSHRPGWRRKKRRRRYVIGQRQQLQQLEYPFRTFMEITYTREESLLWERAKFARGPCCGSWRCTGGNRRKEEDTWKAAKPNLSFPRTNERRFCRCHFCLSKRKNFGQEGLANRSGAIQKDATTKKGTTKGGHGGPEDCPPSKSSKYEDNPTPFSKEACRAFRWKCSISPTANRATETSHVKKASESFGCS
mmetsp:Transcript_18515/g.45439  ORF Transcript_18515/g.45439 Transcript_18515/m.45439 type:complete len:207 (-) Transcript_18515:302-922(-)